MTRDEFRETVFQRDSNKCVICGAPAVDAHHIIDRSLFSDGGYHLDNGASLCETHHYRAEKTTLSCDEIRAKAGITNILLPEHFYDDYKYDKWGNIILPIGQRIKGELFFEPSVQKILDEAGLLDIFQKYMKHPRTFHLPWSNPSSDDKLMKNDDCFRHKRVIVTLKMDGENTTIYNDYVHARSLDNSYHESRNWVKGLWSQIGYLLDDNMRICGENLYAAHTVKYRELPSYFMMFSMWINNTCLSWDETVEYSKLLGLKTVPVIYDGIYDMDLIMAIFTKYELENEGYVIRIADEYNFIDFRRSIGKYVRPVFKKMVDESTDHWMSKKIEVNGLLK
jgi:hypothetical protein